MICISLLCDFFKSLNIIIIQKKIFFLTGEKRTNTDPKLYWTEKLVYNTKENEKEKHIWKILSLRWWKWCSNKLFYSEFVVFIILGLPVHQSIHHWILPHHIQKKISAYLIFFLFHVSYIINMNSNSSYIIVIPLMLFCLISKG